MTKLSRPTVFLAVALFGSLLCPKAHAVPFPNVFDFDSAMIQGLLVTQIRPTITTDILRLIGNLGVPDDIGDLTSEVWGNGLSEAGSSLITYVFTVTPNNSVDNSPAGPFEDEIGPPSNFGTLDYITQFNTVYAPIQNPPNRIGWSFSDALAAGGTGTSSDFIPFRDSTVGPQRYRWGVEFDADGTAADTIHLGTGWANGASVEPITFYFTVEYLPGSMGSYSIEGVSDPDDEDPFGSGRAYRPGNIAVVPEPGTFALCLVGLLGVIGTVRARRTK